MISANSPITPSTARMAVGATLRPQYMGRKVPVQVAITKHCWERWSRAFSHKPLHTDIDAEIARRFNRATRITHLGAYEKRRARHGKDTSIFAWMASPSSFRAQSSSPSS